MGYSVSKDKNHFRIIYESTVDGKKIKRHVKKKEWGDLGFSTELTLEQAKNVAKHLNAELKISRQERLRNKLVAKRELENLKDCAYLPQVFVQEFEKMVLQPKGIREDHWETTKKVIREVNIDPKDWYFLAHNFYNHFAALGYSIDYSNRLRRLLNEWGRFLSRKKNSFWQDIPAPRGKFANRIRENYEKKTNGGRYRARLSLELLQSKRTQLKKPEYNWLLISVAFGLRPEEINVSLKTKNKWGYRNQALYVYQYKLERSEPNAKKRWKKIDIHFPHQKDALEVILSGLFKAPSRATLRNVFGEKMTYYSGRKEFFPFMKSKKFDAYTISAWLGHRSLETTRRHYDDPEEDFVFDELSQKAVNE